MGDTEGSLDKLRDFEAVVCCQGGGLKTHKIIIDAIKGGNVKRFIPSSFTTMDPDDLPIGHNFFIDSHRDVYNYCVDSEIPFTLIINGIFYEYCTDNDFLGMNFKGKVHIYGDGKQKFYTTYTKDVGKFLVKILNDETKVNKKIHIGGQLVDQNQVVELFEKLGFKFEKDHVSLEELEKQIESEKDYMQNGILKFRKGLFFTNANKLKIVNEKEYLDVKVTSLEDFAKTLK